MRSLLPLVLAGCRLGPTSEPPPSGPRLCHQSPVAGCFVEIEAGSGLLGAQAEIPAGPGFDPLTDGSERPVRSPALPGFWLQRDEVRSGDFARCLEAGACQAGDGVVSADPDLPVATATRGGAERYCAWVGARLPSDDEWERAARGLEGRRFPWGSEPRCAPTDPYTAQRVELEIPRVLSACGALVSAIDDGTEPPFPADDRVRQMCRDPQAWRPEQVVNAVLLATGDQALTPSTCAPRGLSADGPDGQEHPLGLRWMAGNLAEWTADPFDDPGDELGVLRGGSWLSTEPREFRAAARLANPPGLALPDAGIRCAR